MQTSILFSLFLSTFGKICSENHICTFFQVEPNYFGLIVQNLNKNLDSNFFGYCDLETLLQWELLSSEKMCFPDAKPVYRVACDVEAVARAEQCNCHGALKNRQLLERPDLPTCILGGRCLDSECTLVRQARKTVINNCIQCMAKHPVKTPIPCMLTNKSKRVWSTSSRVKRTEIIGKRAGLSPGRYFPRTGCDSTSREYRTNDIQNKQAAALELDDNGFQLERSSNAALNRIFRAISKRQNNKNEQTEDDDDDDEEEDNVGEDIAIEEDQDEESNPTTTEEPEKDELKEQQLHNRLQNQNITDNDTDTKSGQRKIYCCKIFVIASIYISKVNKI